MLKAYLGLLVIFMFLGCAESDLVNTNGELTLTVNLPKLNTDGSNTYEYQAWLLINGTFVFTGSITDDLLNDSGVTELNPFTGIDTSDLADADAFAITVEVTSDTNAPSNYVLMVGNFEGNTANLSINNQTTVGVNTSDYNSTASFTVQTPTTTATDDDINGVWFFENNGTEDVTTLNLNFDDTDVNYQAWLVQTLSDGVQYNLNIGEITANIGADDSSLFITATTDLPEFTGEDFVGDPSSITFPENTFPLDVTGGTVMITAIPTNYSSDTQPFPIVIFTGNVPTGTTGSINAIQLEHNTGVYSATAVR